VTQQNGVEDLAKVCLVRYSSQNSTDERRLFASPRLGGDFERNGDAANR